MTLKARLGVSAGIDNELSPTAGANVFTAGTVAGFTATLAGHGRIFRIQTRMGTGGKLPNNRRMTIGASVVTDKMSARNFQWNCHGRRGGRTGNQKKRQNGDEPQNQDKTDCPFVFQRWLACAREALVMAAALMISEAISLDRSPPVGKTV